MNAAPQSDRSGAFARPSVRRWPAVLTLAAGGAVVGAVQFGGVTFSGRPSVDLVYIIAAIEAVFFIWLMAFSRISPITRVKVLASCVVLIVGFSLATYVDGYHGDGRPILTWRSLAPVNRESKLPSHLAEVDGGTPGSAIDLSATTELDSPQFRGSDRSGIVRGVRLSRDWSRTPPKLLWWHPIGMGWSSFAVRGDFCVTQEQWGEEEVVACYELRTGRARWVHRDTARFHEVTGGDGPRATPTIQGGRVFALGATGILNCLDGSNGRPIWSRNILADAKVKNRPFGMASSPLVLDGMVVVCPGGKGRSLVAYEEATGKFLWGCGDSPAGYSSPVSTELAGARQILNFNADGLFAHDIHTGRLLWNFPWLTPPEMNNVCQPIPLPTDSSAGLDRVFISSGYNKGSAVLGIKHDADGFHVESQWANKELKAKFSSCVIHDGFVYGLDERILTCLDLRTGTRRWKSGRYGYGQLVLVDDLLLIQADSGGIALVEASPDAHRELARFPALEHRTWNYPVVAGSLLLVRNDREAACYELPLDEGSAGK